MRKITPEKLAAELNELLGAAQGEAILVMKGDRPSALILGVEQFENYDAEDWGYMTDPEFWRMVRERRKDTRVVSLEAVKARLAADEAKEASRQAPRPVANVQKS